jgi:aspartokinase/homoserine dehydrogenase 1
MRKMMILARETGLPIEMSEITNQSFMPEACMQGSVEDFYKSMEANEHHFKQRYLKAAERGAKLKYVATFHGGKAAAGLQEILPEHDFFHLYGKDNIILFYTNRYPQQPLVVKGAGAGADVTAAGVFADIIRAAGN